jgi:hypothetical protein
MTANTKWFNSYDDLKASIEGAEAEFWYDGLLYYIDQLPDGKWLIYANRKETMGHPIWEKRVDNPFTFDFGDGKTLKDIWQDIEPELMTAF